MSSLISRRAILAAMGGATVRTLARTPYAMAAGAGAAFLTFQQALAADTKLSALATGTTPLYFYGEEGGVSKKYNGFGFRNVKDFGATGGGSIVDRVAIQAAINSLNLEHSVSDGICAGIVFFPPGDYLVDAAIGFTGLDDNLDIILMGCGKASRISGNFNGWIIDKSGTGQGGSQYTRTIKNLSIKNTHASGGGIRMFGTWPGKISECHITAHHGINCDDNSGGINVEHCQLFGLPGTYSGTGISVTGESTIYRCDIIGFGTGISACGVAGSIIGVRSEICGGYGLRMGIRDSDSSTQGASGWLVSGYSIEGNKAGMYIKSCTACTFTGIVIQGLESYPSGSIAGITIPAGADNATYCTFSNIICASEFDTDGFVDGVSGHGIYIGFGQQGLTMEGVVCNASSGTAWVIHQEDCTQFRACNQPAPATATFANAPGTTGGGPLEGDMHTFTDSNTAAFGATIAAGGANVVVGRWSSRTSTWKVAALA